MIALHSDCLLFQLHNGESVPCSADMICVEIVGESRRPARTRNAPARRRQRVSLFQNRTRPRSRDRRRIFPRARKGPAPSGLHAFTPNDPGGLAGEVSNTDLARLLSETGDSLELFFFPRLRDELRVQLRQSPRVVRFRGLRGCVKKLAGARRWSSRCERLEDQIISFLRECLNAETAPPGCALVVE